MSKTKNYEAIKSRIEELAAAEKAKTISPDETVELFQKREELRRHEAAAELKNIKAAMAQAKRDAIARILIENGIETENAVKDILRFVAEARPELIPGKTEPEKKKTEPEKRDEAAAPDADDQTEPKGDCQPDASSPEVDEKTEQDSPKCETCGADLVRKQAKDGHVFYGCPNWKPGEKHTSRDIA